MLEPTRCLDGVYALENEESDVELDNIISKLDIGEYQEHRLSNILANKLDTSNPVAISKNSSTYTFESETREYRITIEVDIIGREHKSSTNIQSFKNALRSPIFVITGALFSAIVCVLVLTTVYTPSITFTSFPDHDASTLVNHYSRVLDQCAVVMKDGIPNPRSNGVQYAICEKAMLQFEELCKEYPAAICQDQRVELYHIRK
jgi:hypothetical protein